MHTETERLLLRKPVIEDFEGYWLMKNDEAATRFTGGITPYSYEERREMYRREWVEPEQKTELSIVLKANKEYIGYCGFVDNEELIYGIKSSMWGKGFGFEAVRAAIEYGFEVLKLPYITATVDYQNTASEKIMQKAGMSLVAELTEYDSTLHKYKLMPGN